MNAVETARRYRDSGLCVLPAKLEEKRPALRGWRQYQQELPDESWLQPWFENTSAVCVLTGNISGNLEMIDFDYGGELFEPWKELVESISPGLVGRLVIETTQSGGRHVIYRCNSGVAGNQKLAQRRLVTPNGDEVSIAGKTHKPRLVGDEYEVIYTLIETRGEGGLFLCDPSPRYKLEQGSLDNIPVVTGDERKVLINSARALSEYVRSHDADNNDVGEGRPGDDYNQRGDIRGLLEKHGWTLVRDGVNQYWCRPGKDNGVSATLRGRVFYVFTTNAPPFDSDRAYSPFTVFALLEHNGDFGNAASALNTKGFGLTGPSPDVDLSKLFLKTPAVNNEEPEKHPDPGPIPDMLLRIPGFISEVMDLCMATAPYPNQALAFCGALALQAVLSGRKVRDEGDNRTNLYLLALAFSSSGKDWPRKINTHILQQIGMLDALGEKFASGEGIQDALLLSPSLLFQTDEIDGLLQSINKSREARHESLLGTLLTMYSSANSVYPMRRKAGKQSPGVIDQPNLVVLGTAIPNHYYDALSERLLTNGFFARTITVESGPRSSGQEPGIITPSASVLDAAKWWSDFNPGQGNLEKTHPQPRIVVADPVAQDLLVESRLEAERQYSAAESCNDPVGTAVWGRVNEQIRKLALIHAISEFHDTPRISESSVRWATEFMMHQTQRMLFMAEKHVADNPFHADCLKLKKKLLEAPGFKLPHSVLLKRMKIEAAPFQRLINTLEQQRDIEIIVVPTAGRPQRSYRLIGTGSKDEG